MLRVALLNILLMCIMQPTYCIRYECNAKNLLQLLYNVDKHMPDTVRWTFREKYKQKRVARKHDKHRKRQLPKDTCQMIFLADTIHFIEYYPYMDGMISPRSETVMGNNIYMNYCFNPDPERDGTKFAKKMMQRISEGNYRQINDSPDIHHETETFTYYVMTRKEENSFCFEEKHFVWGNWSPDLEVDEYALYEVPDWKVTSWKISLRLQFQRFWRRARNLLKRK